MQSVEIELRGEALRHDTDVLKPTQMLPKQPNKRHSPQPLRRRDAQHTLLTSRHEGNRAGARFIASAVASSHNDQEHCLLTRSAQEGNVKWERDPMKQSTKTIFQF